MKSTEQPSAGDETPVRQGGDACILAGDWSVLALASSGQVRARTQALAGAAQSARWDLEAITRLDTVGASLLWRAWGERLPDQIALSQTQRDVFDMLAAYPVAAPPPAPPRDPLALVYRLGGALFAAGRMARDLLTLVGQVLLDIVSLVKSPLRGPWREISAQVFHTGASALGITALVGFLIGVVLSYLTAEQLRLFGAGQLIVPLLGVSIVRELGPVLAAILVAGRSGSAITAQIGVMRVTQELDAMRVMGISHSQRLIMPRAVALALTMPLLTLWTDAMALCGGMLAAWMQLGLAPGWFIQALPKAVAINHYFIGLGKAVSFGILIALVGCYFGLRIQPNTESLGRGTTASVVTSITGVILLDALYAVVFSKVGI